MRVGQFFLPTLVATAIALCQQEGAAKLAPRDLVGVWASERSFGPAVASGEILVSQSGGAWMARLANSVATGHAQADQVTFSLGDGNELRVRRVDDELVGQWIQPITVSTTYHFASPVRFTLGADGSWSGHILPISDVQHAYLTIEHSTEGTLSAFVRNPEENFGASIGVRTATLQSNHLILGGTDAQPLVGIVDASARTMAFHMDGFPGSFVFRKIATAPGPSYVYSVPPMTDDGWKTGSLDDAGINEARIRELVQLATVPATSTRSPYIQSILIARHGNLILDEYFNGYDRTRPHDVRSAGKSVTTLMVGAALSINHSISPSTPLSAMFPQYLPFAHNDLRKQRMTVADLMTMSSGLACDDNDDSSPGLEDTMQSQTAVPDWYKFTLDLPMVSDPGTKAAYCSAGINLLGGVITKLTDQWLPDFFYDRFAKPMQFGQYGLWLTPPPLDTAYMAGGDYFLPRDFLKFGQLFLNRGYWNGQKIVDSSWLQASVTPRSGLNAPGDYGYGWHLLTYKVNGETYEAYNAGGNGGQLLIVIPKLDMAVMMTAANYGQYPVWQSFVNDLVPKYILQSTNPTR